jgi:hypothetical protein
MVHLFQQQLELRSDNGTMGLFDGISLSNFIPGLNTVKGVLGGVGKLLQGDISGAIKSVGKGLSNDWLVGIVFPPMLAPQLVATGMDVLGAFGPDQQGAGRQPESTQYAAQQQQPAIQGPNIGW